MMIDVIFKFKLMDKYCKMLWTLSFIITATQAKVCNQMNTDCFECSNYNYCKYDSAAGNCVPADFTEEWPTTSLKQCYD